jgi:hypothetical protein
MDRAALDAAYNNSTAVANSAQIVAGWQVRSDALRGSHAGFVTLRYGSKPKNLIDDFEAGKDAPLLVFVHGGYWQMRARDNFYFLASGPFAHGISVAFVGYTLAPEIRLEGIIAEVRAALDLLQKRHPKLVVSGWSAGGHLAAMMMSHPVVESGLAISGLYDLEPIRLCYLNEKLGLDDAEAQRNSPLRLPCPGKPLVLAYGTAELAELQRQSEAYAQACPGAARLALQGHDHFTILEELASPDGALTRQVRTLIGQR